MVSTTHLTANADNAVGKLALEVCGKALPLRILHSQRGYYIGTFDDEAGPCSRESVEYFRQEAQAVKALESGSWTQKMAP